MIGQNKFSKTPSFDNTLNSYEIHFQELIFDWMNLVAARHHRTIALLSYFVNIQHITGEYAMAMMIRLANLGNEMLNLKKHKKNPYR